MQGGAVVGLAFARATCSLAWGRAAAGMGRGLGWTFRGRERGSFRAESLDLVLQRARMEGLSLALSYAVVMEGSRRLRGRGGGTGTLNIRSLPFIG